MARLPIEHIADQDVDEALDRELRSLLSVCFTRPQDHVFRQRRYWKEQPAYRWLMRTTGGDLVAQVAVHDKTFIVQSEREGLPAERDSTPHTMRVAGIAEVCVHPAARGMGHVKELLGVAHAALEEMGFEFAALFGKPEVYRSSGYLFADNPVYFLDDTDDTDDAEDTWHTKRFDGRESGAFLWRPLARSDWPQGTIDIRGPKF
ncbi:MAG: GNAT family N-acetyltransferase [Alkalispirochaeta sp.]